MKHKFNYNWTLKDANFTKDKGTVFSCFACGGGSSMGYKLAGFDVVGANDIDKKMSEVYKHNHNPKYYYLESITTLAKRKDLPKELYNLDILDGSPPCSSFSTIGNREKDWGKEKQFKEGQAKQVLDTLFFDFIDLAKELQPKVVIAENVQGLMLGAAMSYVRKIYNEFDKAGYYCQHFLLNAAKMGVPQRRKRVFFVCLRKDLAEPFLYQKDLFDVAPKIELKFNEKPIYFRDIFVDYFDTFLSDLYKSIWDKRQFGDLDFSFCNRRIEGRNPQGNFQYKFIYMDKVLPTIVAGDQNVLYDYPRNLNKNELISGGSFPTDYDFLGIKPVYLIGMSVPPLMTANIATEVWKQWLSKLK